MYKIGLSMHGSRWSLIVHFVQPRPVLSLTTVSLWEQREPLEMFKIEDEFPVQISEEASEFLLLIIAESLDVPLR
jgi:hypothetical protein